MIEEGYYDATIVNAHVEVDEKNDGELVLSFNVRLEGAEGVLVTCRHRTGGEYGHIGRKVAETLGIDWPNGLETIGDVAGTKCRVHIKHKEGRDGRVFENAYIVVPRESKPATAEQIKAGIEKLKLDDNVPF